MTKGEKELAKVGSRNQSGFQNDITGLTSTGETMKKKLVSILIALSLLILAVGAVFAATTTKQKQLQFQGTFNEVEKDEVNMSFIKGVTDTIVEMSVRFAARDVTVATVISRMNSFVTPDGVKHENERHIRTFILVERSGRWFVMQDQNTTIAGLQSAKKQERAETLWRPFINGIGMQSEPRFNVINGIGGMS